MDAESRKGKGDGGSGLPGVRSLFGRGGFPGKIKAHSTQSPARTGSSQQAPGALEDEVSGLSLNAATPTAATRSSPTSLGSRPATPSSPPSAPDSISAAAASPAGERPRTPDGPTATAGQSSQSSDGAPPQVAVSALRSMSETRLAKFHRLLDEPVIDLEALRELAWTGIPPHLRPMCWRLLLGYLPPNRERRDAILARKRNEYREMVPEYYDTTAEAQHVTTTQHAPSSVLRASDEESALRQVAVDVPRTAPGVPFFHLPQTQKSLERVLYIWGIRHPASGYVQGINDLVTPFMAVFMSEKLEGPMEGWNLDEVPEDELLDAEADCYWCLCKLLDGIQDHYTYAQPGIQRTLFHVRELVARVEAPVAAHLEKEGVEFMQFAFRWVNCLLLRELPFNLGTRLWDTYLAEGPGLKGFLVYVLSSFLLSWAPQLQCMEFQELIMFLQRMPTKGWTESDVEMVLSRAYMWRVSFKGAASHFS